MAKSTKLCLCGWLFFIFSIVFAFTASEAFVAAFLVLAGVYFAAQHVLEALGK